MTRETYLACFVGIIFRKKSCKSTSLALVSLRHALDTVKHGRTNKPLVRLKYRFRAGLRIIGFHACLAVVSGCGVTRLGGGATEPGSGQSV